MAVSESKAMPEWWRDSGHGQHLGCCMGNPGVIPGLPVPIPQKYPYPCSGYVYFQVWVWVPAGSSGLAGWARIPMQIIVGWVKKPVVRRVPDVALEVGNAWHATHSTASKDTIAL